MPKSRLQACHAESDQCRLRYIKSLEFVDHLADPSDNRFQEEHRYEIIVTMLKLKGLNLSTNKSEIFQSNTPRNTLTHKP